MQTLRVDARDHCLQVDEDVVGRRIQRVARVVGHGADVAAVAFRPGQCAAGVLLHLGARPAVVGNGGDAGAHRHAPTAEHRATGDRGAKSLRHQECIDATHPRQDDPEGAADKANQRVVRSDQSVQQRLEALQEVVAHGGPEFRVDARQPVDVQQDERSRQGGAVARIRLGVERRAQDQVGVGLVDQRHTAGNGEATKARMSITSAPDGRNLSLATIG